MERRELDDRKTCVLTTAFCRGARVATLSLDERSDQCPEMASQQGTSELTALQPSSFLEEHWKPLCPEAHESFKLLDYADMLKHVLSYAVDVLAAVPESPRMGAAFALAGEQVQLVMRMKFVDAVVCLSGDPHAAVGMMFAGVNLSKRQEFSK
ncbi:hypothetical protein DPX16_16654 [Anabarilius grahami]|uniref:Uncharacterized protein n=1 Tax=Anabarilius grahami TaxID=495550 RepID=A0A3N0YS53_ANAGA|nr:hypothetical protein DPX16_16654 [Anabarilius grahami]